MQIFNLRRFMRFVTRSCVCNAGQITVIFNGLSGLGRRTIAHTCDCSLELLSTLTLITLKKNSRLSYPKQMTSIHGEWMEFNPPIPLLSAKTAFYNIIYFKKLTPANILLL